MEALKHLRITNLSVKTNRSEVQPSNWEQELAFRFLKILGAPHFIVRPSLKDQEGPLHFLFRYGEDHLPCGWNVGMLLIVGDLEIPRPFFALYPLTPD